MSYRGGLIVAFIAGSLSSLAFAPYFFFPLLFISQTLLLLLIDKAANKKQAFVTGWAFGFGHFIVGIHWIYHSLMVDFDKFAILIPLVVIVLPSLLAIYIAIAALCTYMTARYKLLAFCCFWVLGEYLRGNLFTGFPWNLMGYSLAFSDPSIQISSIIGVYGLSFMVLLLTSAPYLIIKKSPYRKIALLTICLMFGANYLYGHIRLQKPTSNTDIAVRIVQPATKQEMNFDFNREISKLNNLITLSQEPSKLDLKLIIWPESAFGFDIDHPGLIDLIKNVADENSYLITSAISLDREEHKWSNSMFVINNKGQKLNEYKKVHLVPFGEYIPLRSLIPFDKIVSSIIDVDCSKGDKAQNIDIGGNFPIFRPLICYEDIFANEVETSNQAKFLISLTNDSWFGTSSGPYQHFQMSRFRSIEQGIPLLRAARTGISAIVDSYGRVINQTELLQKTNLDGYLPKNLSNKTIYSKYGDSTILSIIALSFLFIFGIQARDKK